MHKRRDEYLEKINDLLKGQDVEAIRRDLEEFAPGGKLILGLRCSTGGTLLMDIDSGRLTVEQLQNNEDAKQSWNILYGSQPL